MNDRSSRKILIGSTFPLTLIRRRVVIEPVALAGLRQVLSHQPPASYWGHKNTLAIASQILGVDIAPASDRPALRLNEDGKPKLDGEVFDECWVLSPEYEIGYRPSIGEEVLSEKITGWQVLKMSWE